MRQRCRSLVLVLSILGLDFCHPDKTHAGAAGTPASKQVDLTWGMKIAMRDGVQLNATLYKPQGRKEPGPVIFTMTLRARADFFVRANADNRCRCAPNAKECRDAGA